METQKVIFDSYKGVTPNWESIKKQISDFAASKEIEATQSEISSFLEEIDKRKAFIITINLNYRKHDKGGSVVVFNLFPIGIMGAEESGVRFKTVLTGKHNWRRNKDKCDISSGLCFTFKTDKEVKQLVGVDMLSFLEKNSILHKIKKPAKIEVFNYKDNLDDFLHTALTGIIARPNKLKSGSDINGRRVIVICGNRLLFGIVEKEIDYSWPKDYSNEYKAAYKIKRWKSETITHNEEDKTFGSVQMQYSPESQRKLENLWKKYVDKEVHDISLYEKNKESIKTLLDDYGLIYKIKPTSFGVHFNISDKFYDLRIWLVRDTAKMGMQGFGQHENTKVFQVNNSGDFRPNIGRNYGTSDFDEFLETNFNVFANYLREEV